MLDYYRHYKKYKRKYKMLAGNPNWREVARNQHLSKIVDIPQKTQPDVFIAPKFQNLVIHKNKEYSSFYKNIIFDFDQTISEVHTYIYLSKKQNNVDKQIDYLERNPSEITKIFGSKDRIEMLKSFFTNLKSKHYNLYICSYGKHKVITYLLFKILDVDPNQVFTAIYATSPNNVSFKVSTPKYTTIKNILGINHSDSYIFVDDDNKQFDPIIKDSKTSDSYILIQSPKTGINQEIIEYIENLNSVDIKESLFKSSFAKNESEELQQQPESEKALSKMFKQQYSKSSLPKTPIYPNYGNSLYDNDEEYNSHFIEYIESDEPIIFLDWDGVINCGRFTEQNFNILLDIINKVIGNSGISPRIVFSTLRRSIPKVGSDILNKCRRELKSHNINVHMLNMIDYEEYSYKKGKSTLPVINKNRRYWIKKYLYNISQYLGSSFNNFIILDDEVANEHDFPISRDHLLGYERKSGLYDFGNHYFKLDIERGLSGMSKIDINRAVCILGGCPCGCQGYPCDNCKCDNCMCKA